MALDKMTHLCNRKNSTMHLKAIILENEKKVKKNMKEVYFKGTTDVLSILSDTIDCID